MKVLFSPIGNSDPWRNYRDGAMLHIVRQYQPEYVVLFFTESIWEGNSKVPGAKDYRWEQIIQSISPQTQIEIKVKAIEEEHDFDSYKEVFYDYISEIEQNYHPDQLLLNITSGTPQMESTLCLEYIIHPNNKSCVQVTTPALSSNVGRNQYANPSEQDEDLKQVNANEENESNRCREVNIISFRETMIRTQLKSLIENYDYEAALTLTKQQSSFRNKEQLVEKLSTITKCIKTHTLFPAIKQKYEDPTLQKSLYHYLLLSMRFNRQDLAETLIRVKSIAEFIALNYIRNNYQGVISYKNGKAKFNVKNTGFMTKYDKYLSQKGFGKKIPDNLGLPAFLNVLNVVKADKKIIECLDSVMAVNNLRNSVAHQLEHLSLDKNSNINMIEEAVEAVQQLIILLFTQVEEADFEYFKNLNDEIRELL